ncbi:hypothetical protein DESUT3_10610 [Desulfuromonas versatilis]|uniref:SMP-30/Gluconolactonase/LRE-like region domain-containing protein n=1 Tax=Desulfuromonas versatilis TaxID=2802975 RepID=A0ABM8HTG2_9BACT|nr:SMP-30/gluconolactonase/LRE family protein [Desulfuromonas versatilis]BCR03992.1 hypothetical protein DESUT3_10610 [Desulfuromonas versatilis]
MTDMSRWIVLNLLSCLLLCGCAPFASGPGEEAAPALQWPPPPLPARIVRVGEIDDYRLFTRKPTLWTKVVDLLSGGEPARLVRPYGIHSDGNGRVLVADTGGSRVLDLDTARGRYEVLTGTEEGTLKTPIAITGDGLGHYYITDSSRGMVFRYSPGTGVLAKFTKGHLLRPTGIAFNRHNQHVYVSDTAAHQVVAFDLAGIERFRIGTRGSAWGEFNFPTDLFVDNRGQVFVTDSLNWRVQVLTPEGQLVTQFGRSGDSMGYFAKPKGVAADSEGHIYVVDALLGSVQVFDDEGQLLLTFGTHGRRDGEFWMPSGICIDQNDRIYVTDTYNRRIQIFQYVPQHAPHGVTAKKGSR